MNPSRRAQLVIGALGVLIGAYGLLVTRHLEATAPHGVRLAVIDVNPASAFITLVLGAVAALGALNGRRGLGTLAGYGFLAAGLAVVMGAGQDGNLLGATAATLGFFLGAGGSLLAVGADW